MNKPKIFRALACALLATSVATVGALVTPPPLPLTPLR